MWWRLKRVIWNFRRFTFNRGSLGGSSSSFLIYLVGASIMSSRCTEPLKRRNKRKSNKSSVLAESKENIINPLSLTCRSRKLPTYFIFFAHARHSIFMIWFADNEKKGEKVSDGKRWIFIYSFWLAFSFFAWKLTTNQKFCKLLGNLRAGLTNLTATSGLRYPGAFKNG